MTAKRVPERATETQHSAVRFDTAHQDSAVRFVTAKRVPENSHQDTAVRFGTAKRGPERATETRQYDLLLPSVGQKKPPRLCSTICYSRELARKSHRDTAVRFVTAESWPENGTGQELARKSHRDSAVRFVPAKSWPERATETRQYDLSRPRVGQK